MKTTVEFEGHRTELDSILLHGNEIDVDFNGHMMVRFINNESVFTAQMGINGWGNSITDEIYGKPLIIVNDETDNTGD